MSDEKDLIHVRIGSTFPLATLCAGLVGVVSLYGFTDAILAYIGIFMLSTGLVALGTARPQRNR